jgi:hypothetical protein
LGVLLYDRYFAGQLVAAGPGAATPAPTVTAQPYAKQVVEQTARAGSSASLFQIALAERTGSSRDRVLSREN